MPFPIQRIQTDRGLEFFAEAVQRRLMMWGIKFRPTKPRSPHLNGKVERTQRADLEEFWATVDPKSVDLRQRLDEWQHFTAASYGSWRAIADRSGLRTDGSHPVCGGGRRGLRSRQGAHQGRQLCHR
jgi:transposase InsO family protein